MISIIRSPATEIIGLDSGKMERSSIGIFSDKSVGSPRPLASSTTIVRKFPGSSRSSTRNGQERMSDRLSVSDMHLLNPHRHQHIKRARFIIFLDQRGGCRIGQMHLDRIAVDLRKNVHQIAGVEANLETIGAIFA